LVEESPEEAVEGGPNWHEVPSTAEPSLEMNAASDGRCGE
jgi:hypothetical protein